MKAASVKKAVQYVGAALVATFFVALLSFIFSFLGTIFCAALAGMMLGALRVPSWKAAPVSLFFPLVIFILLKAVKTDLETRQVIHVALACLGVFWLAYGIAALLFMFESKAPAHAEAAAPVPTAPLKATDLASAPALETAKSNGRFDLQLLEGEWSGDTAAHPEFRLLRMIIRKEQLTLEAVDRLGQVRALGCARLHLHTADSSPALELSEAHETTGQAVPTTPGPQPSTSPSGAVPRSAGARSAG